MDKEARQQHILHLLEQTNGEELLGTRELAEQFGVSEMTIRRDLRLLAEAGLLRRQHGGAVLAPQRLRSLAKEIGIVLISKTGKYNDPFFNALLEGTDRRLHALGYRIAYINTRTEVSTAAQAQALLESHPVDGIILVGPSLGVESVGYLKGRVRALVQTIESMGSDLDTITFDGYAGIRQMVDHLVQHGYRRLGFITGHFDARQQGFLDGVKAHGLPLEPGACVTVPYGLEGWTPDLGHTGACQLMALPSPPEAIVCASDRIAIGAIQWLHQHHLRVPEDVAVTGFDNIAESAFTVPSLTTVHVHKQLMGELAAERVVKRIENEQEIPLLIQTPTHLVIRRSCGSHSE